MTSHQAGSPSFHSFGHTFKQNVRQLRSVLPESLNKKYLHQSSKNYAKNQFKQVVMIFLKSSPKRSLILIAESKNWSPNGSKSRPNRDKLPNLAALVEMTCWIAYLTNKIYSQNNLYHLAYSNIPHYYLDPEWFYKAKCIFCQFVLCPVIILFNLVESNTC